MTYRLNKEQIERVLKLSGPDRFEHFVKRVVDQETLWGLRSEDGWVSGECDGGEKPAFPVWPHEEYASACASGAWASASPASIDLMNFVSEWLPDMAVQGVPIAVFPAPEGAAVAVPASELAAALEDEMAKY